jgi:hypothetical protein
MEYKFEFLSQSFVPSMVSIAFFEVKKAVSAVYLFQSAIILCSVLPRHFKLAFPISSIVVCIPTNTMCITPITVSLSSALPKKYTY